ncbi:uncharacterized protein PSFLO_06906 [Pseudozyma flocculosa]|uniref:Uncharacterized protein n=1 Tax=Pseudozyma flocculosa TaxID=84751 RepID=A0A5C3FAF4_9BASI|nr:uncharacterized protein PSFLO_06906 [Pseudozyma flocculosa]
MPPCKESLPPTPERAFERPAGRHRWSSAVIDHTLMVPYLASDALGSGLERPLQDRPTREQEGNDEASVHARRAIETMHMRRPKSETVALALACRTQPVSCWRLVGHLAVARMRCGKGRGRDCTAEASSLQGRRLNGLG